MGPSWRLLPLFVLAVACSEEPAEAPVPPPVDAPSPAPAGAEVPPAGPMTPPPGFASMEGPKVAVSGTVSYDGEHEGLLRLDFMRQKEDGSCELVDAHVIEFGAWSVEVPTGYGSLIISSFLDVARDGNPQDDPAGAWTRPVKVGQDAVSGIDLVLQVGPPAKDIKLCAAPPDTPPPAGPAPGAAPAPESAPPAAPPQEAAAAPPPGNG